MDWVGCSMYDFGTYDSQLQAYVTNTLPDPNFFANTLTGGNVNFYNYVLSLGKPLAIAEFGKPF